ncbi:PrpF protein-domain-containing protein [Pyrenochaeta sp. MPI-SDFR-AT-0127]|nr:PrpF protein-domain-containing protein [Pyrenochaeta sp. MPI-SDFR-AT-0127]
MARERSRKKVRCSLPAVLMRAGTSKGLFIHRHHLPASEAAWAGPLLAAMGSQNSDARQIDGVGGATSTTSKVAVISPSTRPGVDVDYTFVQVAVGQEVVDFSGNCGNMCSGVGPFALQEGLVHVKPGQRTLDVRIFNTNTSRLIVDSVQVDADGSFSEDGDYVISGVKGTGSEVKVAFVDPAGSMTGKLFPTGRRSDTIVVKERNQSPFSVRATLIDAANPFVVVDESSLPCYLKSCTKESAGYLDHMESIRRAGAVMMGLAPNTEAAGKARGTPKLAIVSPPSPDQLSQNKNEHNIAGIHVLAFSMGKPHPSLQLTGAACLASAVCIEGTVAHRIASTASSEAHWFLPTPERTPSPLSESDESPQQSMSASCLLPDRKTVRISHRSGSIQVEVLAASSDTFAVVDRCIVSRTARRLFEGKVYYYQEVA